MTTLVPEQIQDLPWATLDDLLDAKEDVAVYGKCWAEFADDAGDLRMKRIPPERLTTHVRLKKKEEAR